LGIERKKQVEQLIAIVKETTTGRCRATEQMSSESQIMARLVMTPVVNWFFMM
jgi:hypothetical protein